MGSHRQSRRSVAPCRNARHLLSWVIAMTSAARIAGSACLLAMLPTSCAIADAQPATALRSFYVQSQLEDGEQIVEVSQQGLDVRVRTITVVQAHAQCPGVVVSAYDLAMANTTVQAVAGTPLCSVTEQRFNRAVGEARDTTRETIDWLGWRGSVVASCGDKERRFPLYSARAINSTRSLSSGGIATF